MGISCFFFSSLDFSHSASRSLRFLRRKNCLFLYSSSVTRFHPPFASILPFLPVRLHPAELFCLCSRPYIYRDACYPASQCPRGPGMVDLGRRSPTKVRLLKQKPLLYAGPESESPDVKKGVLTSHRDVDSTCSTNSGPFFVTATEQSTSSPSVVYETLLSTVFIAATTVTVSPIGSGAPGVSSFVSTSCTDTANVSGQPSAGNRSSLGSFSDPASGSTSCTDSLELSLTQTLTPSPFEVTITLAEPNAASTTGQTPGGDGLSNTPYATNPSLSQNEGTLTIFSTSYLTINHLTTVNPEVTITEAIDTVTVPAISSPGISGSPIILTIPEGTDNPLGSTLTVTIYPTSTQPATITVLPALSSPGESQPSSSCDSDVIPSTATGGVLSTVTIFAEPSQAETPSAVEPAPASPSASPEQSICSPVYVTYTLPLEPGQTSCSTGVIAITPSNPCLSFPLSTSPASVSGAGPSGQLTTTVIEPSLGPSSTAQFGPGPFGVSSSPCLSSSVGSVGQATHTISVFTTVHPTVTLEGPATVTITQALPSSPVSGSYGEGGAQPGASSSGEATLGGSIIEITYTPPGEPGYGPSTYVVTFTKEPNTPLASNSVPNSVAEVTVTYTPGSPETTGFGSLTSDVNSWGPSNTPTVSEYGSPSGEPSPINPSPVGGPLSSPDSEPLTVTVLPGGESTPVIVTLTPDASPSVTPGFSVLPPVTVTVSAPASTSDASETVSGYGSQVGQPPLAGSASSPDYTVLTVLIPSGASIASVIPGELSSTSEVSPTGLYSNGQASPSVIILTVPASEGGRPTSLPTPSVTGVVVTYTVAGPYGQNPSTITFTTDLPLPLTTLPSDTVITISPQTSFGPGQSSDITLWPTGNTASTSCISLGGQSETPSVITIWPISTTLATSFVTGSSSCSTSDNGQSSELTSSSTSSSICTTLQSMVSTSSSSSGVPTSATSCTDESSSQISTSSTAAAETSGAGSGTFTNENPPPQTEVHVSKAAQTDTQAPNARPDPTGTDQSQGVNTQTDQPNLWPSNTETLPATTSTGLGTSSQLGMYSFSNQPYGTLFHPYGTESSTLPSDPSASSALPAQTSLPSSNLTTPGPTLTSTPATVNSPSVSTNTVSSDQSGSSTSLSTGGSTQVATGNITSSATLFSSGSSTQSLTDEPVSTSLGSASTFSSNTTGVASPSIVVITSTDVMTSSISAPTGGNVTDTSVPSVSDAVTTPSPTSVSLPSITDAPTSTLNITGSVSVELPSTLPDIASTFGSSPSSSPDSNLTSAIPSPTAESNATLAVGISVTPAATSDEGSPVPSRAMKCGNAADLGDFTLQFDDLPPLQVSNSTDPSTVMPMPVPAPYHRFGFTAGFKVVPPPSTRYLPSSGKLMVQHDGSVTSPAQIGNGPLTSNPCFRFDFRGASLGCNSTDLACVFNFTGLSWDGSSEVVQASKIIDVPACTEDTDCILTARTLDASDGFVNLTAINVTLTVGGETQAWWADDLDFAWTDGSCFAGLCRSRVPNTIMMQTTPFSRAMRRATHVLRWAARAGVDE